MSFKDFLKNEMKSRLEPTFHDRDMEQGKTTSNENPYVKDALLCDDWDDRYFNMAKTARQWQIAFYAMLVLVLMFAFLMVRMANKVKVQPFVVEMNSGIPIAIKSMSEGDPNDRRLILFALEQFIVNARSVLSDETAERALLSKAYAYASDKAVVFLNDYYKENDPFTAATLHTTSIDIVNTLKVGDNTYQITWDETIRDSNSGMVIGKSRYIGDLTYKMGEVDARFSQDNPFGLYVSDVSWSQSKV